MEEKLEEAIKSLADKVKEKEINAIDAQQYAQAALNLSQALIGIKNNKKLV